MQSEWRIPSSAPYFLVSKDGEVRNLESMHLIKPGDNGHGYKFVYASVNKKRINRYVHRLVAECFVDNPNHYNEVNHLDGNKSNNKAENLEWCTKSRNVSHSYEIGIHPRTTPKHTEAAIKNLEKVNEQRRQEKEQKMINKYGAVKTIVDGQKFDSQKEATRWCELKLMERVGLITDLERQVKYELVPKTDKYRAMNYIADFRYKDKNGVTVVEDVKGMRKGAAYKHFVDKKKLMYWIHEIDIKEV